MARVEVVGHQLRVQIRISRLENFHINLGGR